MKLLIYALAGLGVLTLASFVLFLILVWTDHLDQLRLSRLEREARARNAAELEEWPVLKNEPY